MASSRQKPTQTFYRTAESRPQSLNHETRSDSAFARLRLKFTPVNPWVCGAGVHASISAHIAKEYLLDEQAQVWGPNLALFKERLGHAGAKEHIENLYFSYLFVLRAVMKAGPLLQRVAYDTGSPIEDQHTADLIQQLVGFGVPIVGLLTD